MSLLSRIREQFGPIATATPATFATGEAIPAPSVAGLATLAVAERQTTDSAPVPSVAKVATLAVANAGNGDFEDGPDTLTVALADACQGLPIDPATVRARLSPADLEDWAAGELTPEALAAFALALVGETDRKPEPFDLEAWAERAAIAEFDGGLTREEAERIAWECDDRRRCEQCASLTAMGRCVAADRREIQARPPYHPSPDVPRRCVGYRPRRADPDRRTGAQRWPGLAPEVTP